MGAGSQGLQSGLRRQGQGHPLPSSPTPGLGLRHQSGTSTPCGMRHHRRSRNEPLRPQQIHPDHRHMVPPGPPPQLWAPAGRPLMPGSQQEGGCWEDGGEEEGGGGDWASTFFPLLHPTHKTPWFCFIFVFSMQLRERLSKAASFPAALGLPRGPPRPGLFRLPGPCLASLRVPLSPGLLTPWWPRTRARSAQTS